MVNIVIAEDPFKGNLNRGVWTNFLDRESPLQDVHYQAKCGDSVWSSESKRRSPNWDAIDRLKMEIASTKDRTHVSGLHVGTAKWNATYLGKLMSEGGLDMNSASGVLMEGKKMSGPNDKTSSSNKGDIKSDDSFEIY